MVLELKHQTKAGNGFFKMREKHITISGNQVSET